MNLFRTKSIEQMRETAAHSGMAKTLGAFDLILLGIGCVIGTGIFVLTGVAAAKYAGPAVTVSFMISGLACALAGLAYAEFSSIVPASGSAYTYTYASLGEFIAFIVGWNLILEYTVTASAVASGWSGSACCSWLPMPGRRSPRSSRRSPPFSRPGLRRNC